MPPTQTHWHPTALFTNFTTAHPPKPTPPYALIILNQPLNTRALDAVIARATLLICADGGANRLLRYNQRSNHNHFNNGNYQQNDSHLYELIEDPQIPNQQVTGEGRFFRNPDAIVGDLDSLTTKNQLHYRLHSVRIVYDPDQESTDFTKCLRYIRKVAASERVHVDDDTMDVVVLGGLGGRVDQGFSQIHHLFMAEADPSLLKGRIYLLSEQSLSFALSSSSPSLSSSSSTENHPDIGSNVIHLQPGYFAEHVGILPVLGRTLLTTRGLEWDVERWPTEFGGQVSTSNHIRADTIEIDFEGPRPLFTLELDRWLAASGDES